MSRRPTLKLPAKPRADKTRTGTVRPTSPKKAPRGQSASAEAKARAPQPRKPAPAATEPAARPARPARRDDAAIERRLLLDEFELVGDHRRVADLEQHGRRDRVLLGVDVVAEAVGILVRAVDAHRDVVAEAGGEVAGDPVGVPATGRELQAALGVELRLLGDQVDRAARLAAAIQRRARALQDLDALDVRGIAPAAEAAAVVEAVDEIAARGVLVAGEAADREAVPEAAEGVLARDAARQVEGVVEGGDADVLQHLRRDHLHALRQVLERRVAAERLALGEHLHFLQFVGGGLGALGEGAGGPKHRSERQDQSRDALVVRHVLELPG